ncbi:hypothetical protein L7F22_010200 [Adiantum nelumboides]|nr:hypothetical protein [Adiantum nelumboides]
MIEESSEEESRIEDSTIATHRKRDQKIEALPALDLQSKQRTLLRGEVSERQAAVLKQVKTKASIKTSPSANIKRLTVEIAGGYFEGVEENLDKLVDENGGLCKGMPGVATDYKKLLWQTAKSVDASNGEGSRSARDLSLLLDALLKTQSRAILLEFLNPQGFQMIHKMMKQSIKDYKRTPIIRKLLKGILDAYNKRITVQSRGKTLILDVKLKGESIPTVSASAISSVMKKHLSAYLVFAREVSDCDESNLSVLDKERSMFLQHYSDCFSDSLPSQLPPERPEDHGIDLVPGSSPPNRPIPHVFVSEIEHNVG